MVKGTSYPPQVLSRAEVEALMRARALAHGAA
jgi:hypothetical protein